MIYKFDILFKKTLANGGIKVVTYSTLLKNPKAFGENEDLSGAVGTLSLVKEGPEKGFSLNSLLLKYNSLLLDKLGDAASEEGFRLQFSFSDPEDVMSIEAGVVGGKGVVRPLIVESRKIDPKGKINLADTDNLAMIIANSTIIELQGGNEMYCIKTGEILAFCTADEHLRVTLGCNIVSLCF